MPRKRRANKHLPERVYLINGTYYFLEKPDRKWHRLGKTLHEAMANWSKFYEHDSKILTMRDLFERYMAEVAPRKAKNTYQGNQQEIKRLIHCFGELSPNDVTPVDVYKYLDTRGETAPIAANREKSLLSHVFSMAIRWGVTQDNPCKHVKRLTERRRDHYVSDEDLKSVIDLAPPSIANIIEFAYITGLRQSDILKITRDNIVEDGIKALVGKTSNKILIEWSDKLRVIIRKAMEYSTARNSSYLFCNTKGEEYSPHGFRTMWQKLMQKAIGKNPEKKSYVEARFRFHDIRRKTASDIENKYGREVARKLLAHGDQRTTGIYISGYERVKPID
jgi:integrase